MHGITLDFTWPLLLQLTCWWSSNRVDTTDLYTGLLIAMTRSYTFIFYICADIAVIIIYMTIKHYRYKNKVKQGYQTTTTASIKDSKGSSCSMLSWNVYIPLRLLCLWFKHITPNNSCVTGIKVYKVFIRRLWRGVINYKVGY